MTPEQKWPIKADNILNAYFSTINFVYQLNSTVCLFPWIASLMSLVVIMARSQIGNRPLSKPMMSVVTLVLSWSGNINKTTRIPDIQWHGYLTWLGCSYQQLSSGFSRSYIQCAGYIPVIFLWLIHKRHPIPHPSVWGVVHEWKVWAKFCHCNCWAVCTIMLCMTTIYR